MIDTPLVRRLIQLAIEEDLAFGDVTGVLTIPESHHSSARIIARERLIVCGGDLIRLIVQEGKWNLTGTVELEDGEWAEADGVLARLSGSTRDLLAAERTLLNFLQRTSGVATHTHSFCLEAAPLVVLDTRKTMPGWRVLDKYAVRVGGGRNHRLSLGDMILVKNNHIDAHPDGMRGALRDIVSRKALYMPWEVEVRDLDEVRIALEFQPTIIMLDNFSDELIIHAVALVRAAPRPPLIEVSGGITKDRIARLKGSGIDAVSAGSLTTAARNVDISMRIEAL